MFMNIFMFAYILTVFHVSFECLCILSSGPTHENPSKKGLSGKVLTYFLNAYFWEGLDVL